MQDDSHGERITLSDMTYYAHYSEHINRYEFANKYCRGKFVLDAGCGTGYGSSFLASDRETSVIAVDIAEAAIAEAGRLYAAADRPNLQYLVADVERLPDCAPVASRAPYGAVVNLENLEHLHRPMEFLKGARSLLGEGGVLVTSTPNGELSVRDATGKYATSAYHVREYRPEELRDMLGEHFGEIELFGQWKTPSSIFRRDWDNMIFTHLCASYYNPVSRLWRAFHRTLGKPVPAPPAFLAAGSSYPWEQVIMPLAASPYPWKPEVIIAVCRA